MSTVLLAPGVELPVSGKPFGDTPAMDVDNLRRRVTRKARIFVIILVALSAGAFGIIWHVGQPFWGNWSQVNATVTSQYEYVSRGTHCSLGLDYVFNGQHLHNSASIASQCTKAPAIGSTVILGVAPGDPNWIALSSYKGSLGILLMVTCTWTGLPVAGWALATALAIHRRRRVLQLGTKPWQEVAGVVTSSNLRSGGLALELAVDGYPSTVRVMFGMKGISFFPTPGVGSSITLRLTGDGSGFVLVSLPGHWGESIGTICPSPARQPSN
jgi:hypothetical protein